uniref:Uncharacterized protein n=1 Tax=Romanomermis culicivorax TaxID=13658 RepID=A0A915IKT1_ROMCU
MGDKVCLNGCVARGPRLPDFRCDPLRLFRLPPAPLPFRLVLFAVDVVIFVDLIDLMVENSVEAVVAEKIANERVFELGASVLSMLFEVFV